MRKIIPLLLLALASSPVAARMYKWVDEKGVTHYGDSIPPQYVNQGNSEMNPRGVLLKKTERALTPEQRKAQEEAQEKEKEAQQKEQEQQRHDKALINTYTSEKEIDLARDRNLQQADLQIKGAELRLKQVDERLAKYRSQTDAMKKAGKAVPPDLKQDTLDAEQERKHLLGSIQQKRQDMDAIRARFEADKVRYRELTIRRSGN